MIYSKALERIKFMRFYLDEAEKLITTSENGISTDIDKAIKALKQVEKAVYEAMSDLEFTNMENKIKEK